MYRALALPMTIIFLSACSDHQQQRAVEPKPQVSKHSKAFNQSVDSFMDAYYGLTESFVNWDSVAVGSGAALLDQRLDNFGHGELKADTSGTQAHAARLVDDARKDLAAIRSVHNINAQRQGLNRVTQDLYALLGAIRYDEKKLYLQQCPMAFNEKDTGVWISSYDSIRNPYMGLHHPRYGRAMVECGETRTIMDYGSSPAEQKANSEKK